MRGDGILPNVIVDGRFRIEVERLQNPAMPTRSLTDDMRI
jgi:hypothetical protein